MIHAAMGSEKYLEKDLLDELIAETFRDEIGLNFLSINVTN